MSSHHSSSHSPRGGGVNVGSGPEEDPEDTLEDEDDIVRSDLDMHSLILTSNPQDSSVSTYLNGILPSWKIAET